MPPTASQPVTANFPSEKLTIGAGVAIFHLASERVIVCYHSKEHYWFLPKGRKNAGEDICRAAEREGFEESGFRNRLLPLPMKHRQPHEDGRRRKPDDLDARVLAARIIYTQTPETDRKPREIVATSLAGLTQHLEDHKEFAELISEVPEVALGVMRSLRHMI